MSLTTLLITKPSHAPSPQLPCTSPHTTSPHGHHHPSASKPYPPSIHRHRRRRRTPSTRHHFLDSHPYRRREARRRVALPRHHRRLRFPRSGVVVHRRRTIRPPPQDRIPNVVKPSCLAIASPPSVAVTDGVFEFLVKSIAGSTAEVLCGLRKGDVVELSSAMGKGFDTDQISPPEDYQSVFIFATGSAISPIRSLIESGFGADKRSDVRLYYGARNLQRMAYQDRFKAWESSGVTIVPVLSQPHDSWGGEAGYVQAAFARAKQVYTPESTGSVLCGHKQMAEEVTSILVGNGIPNEKILKNF